jgi:hypothetical protein
MLIWIPEAEAEAEAEAEVFTAPLHSNGRGADHIENTVLLLLRVCMLRVLPSSRCFESLLGNGSVRRYFDELQMKSCVIHQRGDTLWAAFRASRNALIYV